MLDFLQGFDGKGSLSSSENRGKVSYEVSIFF